MTKFVRSRAVVCHVCQVQVARDLPIPSWYRTDFNDPSSFTSISTVSTYMPATDPQRATGNFHNSPDNGQKATDYPSVVMMTGDDVTALNAMVERCSGVCVSNPYCSYVSYGFEQGAYFCKVRAVCTATSVWLIVCSASCCIVHDEV